LAGWVWEGRSTPSQLGRALARRSERSELLLFLGVGAGGSTLPPWRPVRAWFERSELRMSWFPTDSQAAGTLTITYLFFFYLLKGGPFHLVGGECFTVENFQDPQHLWQGFALDCHTRLKLL
jgi:hypothetical protein